MIVIDSDRYMEHGIETMFFPGDNQPHCKIPTIEGDVFLFLKLRDWKDVGIAACVIDAMARRPRGTMRVFVPFFPGARQDKIEEGHYPFTIELMIKLLFSHICNLYAFSRKIAPSRQPFQAAVFDPHSRVLTDMWPLLSFNLRDLKIPTKKDVVGIIAPDEGASIRAEDFRSRFYTFTGLVQCKKKRDSATGQISGGYEMPKLHKKGRYIIVDDICDGGRTFNLLAQAFKKDTIGADSSLELVVSHGIFSKGLEAIDKKIEHITTTDSFCGPVGIYDRSRLTVLPLAQLFPKIEELT